MTLVKVNNPLSRSIDGLMKEIFNDFPATFGKSIREDVLQSPPVNIVEKADSYHLELAVPGFEKKDFQVKLENNILTISSEKKEETKEENEKMIRREFSYKSFKRSFTIDEKIDASNINARYDNGILILDLPKKQPAAESVKEISIQ